MSTATRLNLSSHDTTILSALFDPEPSPSVPIPASPSLSPLPYLHSPTLFTTLRTTERTILTPLHTANPSPLAISTALAALTTMLAEHPTYASAYLNRAQTRRLLVPEAELFAERWVHVTANVLADLDAAIRFAMPVAPSDPVSVHQQEILAAACTHRGLLLIIASEVAKTHGGAAAAAVANGDENRVGLGDAARSGLLRNISAERLEEMAAHDFMLGARYGNKTARQMNVRMNPYAKMCGAVVKEALKEEIETGGE